MVLRTLVNFASKRVPLIKFRKGGNAAPAATSGSNQASSSPPAGATPTATQAAATDVIEDWELPQRYWRKPIDPVEMDYINRGGPA